jgi:hypothetical protein
MVLSHCGQLLCQAAVSILGMLLKSLHKPYQINEERVSDVLIDVLCYLTLGSSTTVFTFYVFRFPAPDDENNRSFAEASMQSRP